MNYGVSILGFTVPTTKLEKYLASSLKAEKYRIKYEKTKAERAAKGKATYPDPEGGTHGKSDYNSWKKNELKQSQRAELLQNTLALKGKLSPELQAELTRIIQQTGTAPPAAVSTPAAGAQPFVPSTDADVEMAYSEGGGSLTVPLVIGGVVLVGGVAALLVFRRRRK